MLSSCSQEDLALHSLADDDDAVVFISSLPVVTTRSDGDTDKNSLDAGFQVTAFAPEDETKIGASNKLNEYFADQLVTKTPGMGDAFRSDMCRWPANSGSKKGTLKFFAFYPSCEALRESVGVASNSSYFVLSNTSKKTTTSATYTYTLTKFKINSDISKHVDFVAATAEGNKTQHLYSGVTLTFAHQLSRVDIQAWGAPTSYELEIAGVRMGNVYMEGTCNFSGTWTSQSTRGIVEYIYGEGDKIISVGKSKDKNKSAATAVSIMGNGGHAMVIPGSYSAWNKSKTGTGSYFSVLLRVNDKAGKLLYPYIEGADLNANKKAEDMKVVYLSIEKSSGLVKKRLYKKDGDYYTSDKFSVESIYNIPADEEIRSYGWAAGPISSTTWRAGTQYTLRLGYSSGVGVMDPSDLFPGKPIISEPNFEVEVSPFEEQDWVDVTDRISINP